MFDVGGHAPSRSTKHEILLVEDQAIVALATSQRLKAQGYDITVAGNGEEAVKLAVSPDGGGAKFDLILMDVDLGEGMDGVEASRMILSESSVPIVFLTGHSDPETVSRVREVSRYGYVLKSSGELQLQLAVESALDLFGAHQRIEEREEELEAIYESVPLSLLIVTPDMRVARANREARNVAGQTASGLLGSLVGAVIRCVHAVDDPEACGTTPHCETCSVRRAVRRALDNGTPFPRFEALLPVERAGSIREVRCTVSVTPVGLPGSRRVLVAILEWPYE